MKRKLVLLVGSSGDGWDVETRETSTAHAVLLAHFNFKADADLFCAAQSLLDACEASLKSHITAQSDIADMMRQAIVNSNGGAK